MKAVFLDRDGVINKTTPSGFVLKWDEFKFLPDVIDAIKIINKKKIPIYIISNQSCVGRGYITLQELENINQEMLKELKRHGARIDDIFMCPHAPDAGCDCRKPNIGLFKQAMAKYDIDIKNSWFIGNSDTDIEAGQRIGCNIYLIKEGESLKKVIEKIGSFAFK